MSILYRGQIQTNPLFREVKGVLKRLSASVEPRGSRGHAGFQDLPVHTGRRWCRGLQLLRLKRFQA